MMKATDNFIELTASNCEKINKHWRARKKFMTFYCHGGDDSVDIGSFASGQELYDAITDYCHKYNCKVQDVELEANGYDDEILHTYSLEDPKKLDGNGDYYELFDDNNNSLVSYGSGNLRDIKRRAKADLQERGLKSGFIEITDIEGDIKDTIDIALDGIDGTSGVADEQMEQYQKEIARYYVPYSWSTSDKIYLPDTNLVFGKVKRIASHLSTEQTRQMLDYLRDKENEIYSKFKRHIFTDRHSVWKLADYTAKVEQQNEEIASRKDVMLEFENCNVELSYTDDRLRIIFPGMPSYEQRSNLKHAGFRWSPSNSAWQRQLTDNAIRSVVSDYGNKFEFLSAEEKDKISKAFRNPEHKEDDPKPQPEPAPQPTETPKEIEGEPTAKKTFAFAKHLKELYEQGETLDWRKAQQIASDYNIASNTEIMQACELAVVLTARKIAHNGNSIRQQYEEMKDLYERQVNIQPLDTKSKTLQQYSTPCPLSYLLGKFVQKGYNGKGKILEPSAGNGLLTIAFEPNEVCANEIDEIRAENLKQQGFYKVTSFDASDKRKYVELSMERFSGIITNPPFATLLPSERIERNGWQINTLDYKMAILALDHLSEEGKGAIIVGGKMWGNYWKPLSDTSDKKVLFGQWKTFLGYLYAQYNVVDVIYVNGDNIYRKQGTQYPIVIILIDGRHEYNESNKPNYVFDPEKDTILQTFYQLFDRICPYIENAKNTLTKTFSELVRENGDKLVSIKEATNPNKKYVSPFNYSSSHGSSPDSYRYYNDFVVELSDKTTNINADDNDRERRLRLAKARAKAMIMLQEQRNRETKATLNGLDGIDEETFDKIEKMHKCSSTIEKWINGNRDGRLSIVLPKSVEKKISNILGRRVNTHIIASNGIRHSYKNHGNKGRKLSDTDIPISLSDYMLIPYIMVAPDKIEIGSNDFGRESIRFLKKISNGQIIVVEKESLNDKNVFENVNMWGKLSDVVNAKNPNVHVRNVVISTSDVAKIIKDAETAIIKDKN